MPPANPDGGRRAGAAAEPVWTDAYRIVIELAEPRRFLARASDAL